MSSYLFKDASVVFDGGTELQPSFNIVVKDDRITVVTQDPIEAGDATVIDVAGKTLMPGLIDAHAHVTGLSLSPKNLTYPAAEIVVAAASYLRNCLMAGFTTIRDLGTEGAGYSDVDLKQAVEQGIIPGPRMIVVTRAIVRDVDLGPGAGILALITLDNGHDHTKPNTFGPRGLHDSAHDVFL